MQEAEWGFLNICVAQCEGFNLRATQLNMWSKLSLEACPVVKVMRAAEEDGSSTAVCLSFLTAKPGDGW